MPDAGASHASVTSASPGVAVRLVGANGTSRSRSVTDVCEDQSRPASLQPNRKLPWPASESLKPNAALSTSRNNTAMSAESTMSVTPNRKVAPCTVAVSIVYLLVPTVNSLSDRPPIVVSPGRFRSTVASNPYSVDWPLSVLDPTVTTPHQMSPVLGVHVVWACAGRASAPESANSAAAASARAERTRPRRSARGTRRPLAAHAAYVQGEEPPPRQGGRCSGGDCGWRCSRSRGAVDARRSTLDARRSTLDARRSTLDARRSTLDARRSTLDARRSTLDARRSTLDARRSTLDARRSTQL